MVKVHESKRPNKSERFELPWILIKNWAKSSRPNESCRERASHRERTRVTESAQKSR